MVSELDHFLQNNRFSTIVTPSDFKVDDHYVRFENHNSKLHRLLGPALYKVDDNKSIGCFYIDGIECKTYNEYIEASNIPEEFFHKFTFEMYQQSGGFEGQYFSQSKFSFDENGIIHNDVANAVEFSFGDLENGLSYRYDWFQHGKRHRIGGPAVEHINYKKCNVYYEHGKRHRINGPALDTYDCEGWYENGLVHRDQGPAFMYFHGKFAYAWYEHGLHHNTMGPAVIIHNIDGIHYEFWLNGIKYSVKDYCDNVPYNMSENTRKYYIEKFT